MPLSTGTHHRIQLITITQFTFTSAETTGLARALVQVIN